MKSCSAKLLCLFVIVTGCVVSSCECDEIRERFNILGVFGHLGKSHFDVFLPILEELAHRGHNVTVLSFFPRKDRIPNYRDISLGDSTAIFLNVIDLTKLDHSIFYIVSELKMLHNMAEIACYSALRTTAVKEFLKSDEKFDLILTESFNTDCFLGFVHKFKAPFIGLSSHAIIPWVNNRLNNPDNPSYIPGLFHSVSPSMTFFERVMNTFWIVAEQIAYDLIFTRPMQSLVEETFGPGVPPLQDIANNMTALMVNTHFSLHGARPLSPSVVEIGGVHIRGAKPLPKDLQDFLDSAEHGVLYFSWGSMVRASSMPNETLATIVEALGRLKQKVLWKWENDDLPNKPKNLMTRQWLPQFDVLSHPNVKGFLAHAGLLGLSEAIYVGVPIVAVPMFGDQHGNAKAAEARGAAIILQYEDITVDTLTGALNEILNNPSYRRNARAVSEAYRDRPASALETAVWWAEYVARGKGRPFLRSASANLSWYQYHLLDVIGFLSLAGLAVLFVAVFAVKRLLKALNLPVKKVGITSEANDLTKNETNKKRN
ncbi:UDP-glycosyltransferase UGT5-like [Neodiprion fabricii]|uniref:UDP-glycosyltransferase UGT5-like n=1 Tax=Neodiprion fabricii TaxID=2872261 RepID=UPI001ED8F283|nr:UDP-glycosyltransferase UGT5-like [Neodiprion fabricii]